MNRLLLCVLLVQLAAAFEVYMDTHCHAVDAVKSPEDQDIWSPDEALEWHRSNGYNAMVLTNHMEFDLLDPLRMHALNTRYDDFRVLPGREWWCNNFHLVMLFNPSTYPVTYALMQQDFVTTPNLPNYNWCVDEAGLQTVLQQMHQYDTLVVFAHPHLKANDCALKPTFSQWANWTLDYIERISTSVYDIFDEDAEDAAGWKHHLLAGTDCHNKLKAVPGAFTRITLPANTDFTDSAIWDALVQNRYGSSSISQIPLWVEYDLSKIQDWWWLLIVGLGVLVLAIVGGAMTGGYACYRSYKKALEKAKISSPISSVSVSSK